MSQVIFGTLNVIGRKQPLLLEETIKNLAAFADLQDFKLDDTYGGGGTGWDLGSGVTLSSLGGGDGTTPAYYDDGTTTYDGGFIYG